MVYNYMLAVYLIMKALLAQSQKVECPFMECFRIDYGVCAEIEENGIHINERGCPDDLICSAEEIFKKHRENNFEESPYILLDCYENPNSNPDTTPDRIPNSLVTCPERNKDENLKSGSHPKLCQDDEDCITKNNQDPKCKCGLYGDKYCQPLIGSDIFQGFWNRCEKDSTLTQREWDVWNFFVNNFIYVVSAQPCGEELLEELKFSIEYAIEEGIHTILPYLLLTGVLFI